MANEKDFGGFYNLKWDIWPSLTVAQVIHIFQGNSKFKSSVFLSDNGILCPDIVIKTLLLRKIKVRMEMSLPKAFWLIAVLFHNGHCGIVPYV